MNLVENNWRVGSFFYTLRLRRCHRGSHLPKKFFSYFSSGIVLHSDKDCDLASDKKCDSASNSDKKSDCDLASDQKCDSDQKCNSDQKCDSDQKCNNNKNIKNTPNTIRIWGIFPTCD